MTERRVNATPVSTFVQASRGGVTQSQQRAQQTSGLMKQFGVVMADKRQHDFEEEDAKVHAQANATAMRLEAEYRPQIEAAMRKPETYDMSADDFLQSDTYKLGAQKLEDNIKSPEHKKAFQAQYKEQMMRMYAAGRSKKEYQELEETSSLAQEGQALKGIEHQVVAYENSLAAGVDPDDTFQAGLATAIMQGPEYLEKFATAREWTPEQDLMIQQRLGQLKKQHNSEASIAYKYAMTLKDRDQKRQALQKVGEHFAGSLSTDQKENLIVSMQVLKEEITSAQYVREVAGRMTVDAMLEMDGQRLSRADIMKELNDDARAAIKSGDKDRILQLATIPGDVPTAIKEYFSQTLGAVGDGVHNDSRTLIQSITHANNIFDNLGPSRVREMMSEDAYAAYIDIAAHAEFEPNMETVVEGYKRTQDLLANGKLPTRPDWNKDRASVVDDVLSNPNGDTFGWFSESSSMQRSTAESLLNPHFKRWQVEGLSKDEMTTRARRILKDSSAGGHLNGRQLVNHVGAMTIGENGNPYGERTPEDLIQSYQGLMLEELKQDNPEYTGVQLQIGHNANQVFLVDDSGIPIPSSIKSITDITGYIKANVPTTKQEVINGRTTSNTSPAFERLQGQR